MHTVPSVSRSGSIVLIVHAGEATAETGRRLIAQIRPMLAAAEGERLVFFHDAEHLESAGQDYAMVFSGFLREVPKNALHVAAIPKAWLRLLAKTAAVLGGVDMHLFRDVDEARAYLKTHGYELPPKPAVA